MASSNRYSQSGGKQIPLGLEQAICERILTHAKKSSLPERYKLDIFFKSKFCYIDASEEEEGETIVTHLCRLTFMGDIEKWGLASYTYSSEKYEACRFPSGEWYGTLEEALEVCLIYLV